MLELFVQFIIRVFWCLLGGTAIVEVLHHLVLKLHAVHFFFTSGCLVFVDGKYKHVDHSFAYSLSRHWIRSNLSLIVLIK